VGGTVGGEGDAEGAGGAERRCTADGEPADRVDQLVRIGDVQPAFLVRQRGLVDEADRAVGPVDAPH
jgi:hypothetical protein